MITIQRQRLAYLGLLAVLLALAAEGRASAATRTVHVGRGGTNFVDDVSGTSATTIFAGDTVTWVWEGDMNHSVTSGTCSGNGGGGGGYIYGNPCNATTVWDATGLHGAGFTFSHTFTQTGTFKYFCDAHQAAMTGQIEVKAGSSGPCDPSSAENLCLNDGRFQVTAEWSNATGSGHGTGVKLTADSGYFWFFDSSNIEVTVKVLNGCGLTNSYWVFAAGLTNVHVELTAIDTQTGAVYQAENSQGTAFAPIQNTGAFPTSCP
jgi:plastocyanin